MNPKIKADIAEYYRLMGLVYKQREILTKHGIPVLSDGTLPRRVDNAFYGIKNLPPKKPLIR